MSSDFLCHLKDSGGSESSVAEFELPEHHLRNVPSVPTSNHGELCRTSVPFHDCTTGMYIPTILITGCSEGGIGDALARQFAGRGHYVYATVRNLSKAAHLRSVENINTLALDVTSLESVNSVFKELTKRLPEGKLDILVNCAGVGATGPLIEADLATAKRLFDVNVLGLLTVTQAFAPMLIAAKGKVVNISSVGGILAMPWAAS